MNSNPNLTWTRLIPPGIIQIIHLHECFFRCFLCHIKAKLLFTESIAMKIIRMNVSEHFQFHSGKKFSSRNSFLNQIGFFASSDIRRQTWGFFPPPRCVESFILMDTFSNCFAPIFLHHRWKFLKRLGRSLFTPFAMQKHNPAINSLHLNITSVLVVFRPTDKGL